ncbi:MAG: radical SAM protein [Clostridia bacterium]|nr:radical SAM protein [Clostridia bacterium]
MCGVNREADTVGYCKASDKVRIARADLHMWEEPPISGSRGSGTVFFSGCSLGCIYCQNREISRNAVGREVSDDELVEIFLKLKEKGAHNINLVTPTHFVPSIISAVSDARARGLDIPIVYNTSSYEREETLELLRGTVDVWLPDLKYYKSDTAKRYSNASDLPEVSRRAIAKMVDIAGAPSFDTDGIMLRGVIVRILLLPSHLAEAKLNLKYLYDTYGDNIYISLMSQYTPFGNMPKPLDRRVTVAEYDELVSYAERLGVKNAYIQERESASESFIPPFDVTE